MRRTVVFLQTEGEEKQGGGGRRRRRGTGTLLQMNRSEGSKLNDTLVLRVNPASGCSVISFT